MPFGRTVLLNTGHKFPTLGYGTWQSAPGVVGQGVYEALKIGYRHLDLAKIYENQVEVGKGIKKALAEIPGLKREDIFITSKLWNNSHRPQDVEPALDDTLQELGLDYLDLYLVHWPVAFAPGKELIPRSPGSGVILLDNGVSICQTWKAMTQLPKSKVRSVGVSNFAIEHLEVIINDSGIVPAVNQIERHPRIPNPPLINYCKEKGVVITAYSAFGNNSFGLPLLVNVPEVKAIAERLSQAQGKTITPAQVILAWSQLNAVIPKSVTPERILENFQEVGLDDQAIRDLNKFGENPQRLNLPGCEWNINIFGDEKEKNTTNQVVVNA